jgi:glycosyltransferase involved in cell wall biosynthesis
MPTQIKLANNNVLHYCLDSLVVRRGIVHGHGWAFFSASAVKKMRMEMTTAVNRVDAIEASYGHKRDDVLELHHDATNARYSGFRFQAKVPAIIESAYLTIESEDGESCRIALDIKADGDALRLSSKKLTYLRLIQKAWRLVRRGQFKRLWHAVSVYTTKFPRREKNLAPIVERLIADTHAKNALLVIDHDLGGGANLYRERMLAPLLGHGKSVLMLSFFMPTLQFVLEYQNAKTTKRFALDSLDDMIALANSGLIREVFYNNAVSFHDPARIPEFLIRLKEIDIPVRIALHDYFSICPSFFLLNDRGQYCDLPSMEECNRCLAENRGSFVQEAGVADIADWRNRWGRCLQLADEIICFSQASLTILQRAYPQLSSDRITLRPHTVDYLPRSTPAINLSASLHIGVVGNLTKAKGARIVRELTEEIHKRGLAIPVTVIGTVDAEHHISGVRETGRYTPETLCHLIEKSGANLFLFPSIWPETFSYVVSELIALNVPVVCFDLGAPAERVRNYRIGHVIPYNGPDTLLDALRSFHGRLNSIQLSLSENKFE